MNRGISLTKLIDEAVYLGDAGTKRLAGSITNPDDLARSAPALEQLHKGLFAFAAFHPKTDRAVAEYIENGSIGSDAGPNILVLFFSADEMRFPRPIAGKDLNLGVNLDMDVHPAYQFAQWLFPAGTLPRLPALIFFDRVLDSSNAVYLPIPKHAQAGDVADFCRSVFVLADGVVRDRAPGQAISFDSLCAKLKTNRIEYSRTGDTSAGEWLVAAYQFARKNSGTIVSVISKVAKAL